MAELVSWGMRGEQGPHRQGSTKAHPHPHRGWLGRGLFYPVVWCVGLDTRVGWAGCRLALASVSGEGASQVRGLCHLACSPSPSSLTPPAPCPHMGIHMGDEALASSALCSPLLPASLCPRHYPKPQAPARAPGEWPLLHSRRMAP